MRQKDLLMVLTGPSGSGKTTLSLRLLNEIEGVRKVITTTTRAPRMGEVDGIDYHFQTPEKFADGLEKMPMLSMRKSMITTMGWLKRILSGRVMKGRIWSCALMYRGLGR